MADEIGAVHITIGGDYSKLLQSLQEAQQLAAAAGQKIAAALAAGGSNAESLATGLDDVTASAKPAAAALDDVSTKTKAMGTSFLDAAQHLEGAGLRISAAVTVPIVALGTASLLSAANMEQLRVGFTRMLGSAEAAGEFIQDLKNFAVATPFQFEQLTELSRRMMAMGFEAAKVIPTLKILGDQVAAVGGSAQNLDRIVLALGQMQAKGKVSAQEMNQLAEQMVPAWKILSEAIGVSIPQAMKLAEKGALEAKVAIPAILAGMAKESAGEMENQAKTLAGKWSNFVDSVKLTLMDLGDALAPIANNLLDHMEPILEWAKGAAEAFRNMDPALQALILGIAGLAAAVGPVLVTFGAFAASINAIAAALPAFAAASAAAGPALMMLGQAAIVAAAAFGAWKLGTWLYENVPALKVFGDAIGNLLVKLPGLESAILRISGVQATMARAAADLDFATAKLEKSLAEKGITVERAGRSTEQYAAALRAAAKEAGLLGPATASSVGSTKALAETQVGSSSATKEYEAALAKLKNQVAGVAEEHKKAKPDVFDFKSVLEGTSSEARRIAAEFEVFNRSIDQAKKTVRELAIATAEGTIGAGAFAAEISKMPVILEESATSFDSMAKNAGLLGSSIGGLPAMTDELGSALERVNKMDPLVNLQANAQRAQKDFETLRDSGVATARELDLAWVTWQENLIKIAQTMGDTVPKKQQQALDDMKRSLGLNLKDQETVWKDFAKQVSTIATNLAQDLAQMLWEGGGSFADKGKQALKSLGQAFTASFIEPAIAGVNKLITGALTDLIGGKGLGGAIAQAKTLGSTILNLVGAGGSAATSAAATAAPVAAGAAQAAGKTAQAGGAAASAPGSAVSAPSSTLGNVLSNVVAPISAAVSAVTGVINAFQMARQENTLNAIEESTRYLKILFEQFAEHTWQRHGELLVKADELLMFLRESLGNIFQRLGEIGSGLVMPSGTQEFPEALKQLGEAVALIPEAIGELVEPVTSVPPALEQVAEDVKPLAEETKQLTKATQEIGRAAADIPPAVEQVADVVSDVAAPLEQASIKVGQFTDEVSQFSYQVTQLVQGVQVNNSVMAQVVRDLPPALAKITGPPGQFSSTAVKPSVPKLPVVPSARIEGGGYSTMLGHEPTPQTTYNTSGESFNNTTVSIFVNGGNTEEVVDAIVRGIGKGGQT